MFMQGADWHSLFPAESDDTYQILTALHLQWRSDQIHWHKVLQSPKHPYITKQIVCCSVLGDIDDTTGIQQQ